MTESMQRSTALPRTGKELGLAMRSHRNVGLRIFEKRQEELLRKPGSQGYEYRCVLSRSRLSRFENGSLPPLELADHLDQLYEAEGWLKLALSSLWRSAWRPWETSSEWPLTMHFASWPANFSGLVWAKVVPCPDERGELHQLHINWGPWVRKVEVVLHQAGVVLVTGKARDLDGVSRTLNLTCNKKVHVLFGCGEDLEGEELVDIRQGWVLARSEAKII